MGKAVERNRNRQRGTQQSAGAARHDHGAERAPITLGVGGMGMMMLALLAGMSGKDRPHNKGGA